LPGCGFLGMNPARPQPGIQPFLHKLTCCASISIAGVPSSRASKLVTGQINSLVLKDTPFNTGSAEGIPLAGLEGVLRMLASVEGGSSSP